MKEIQEGDLGRFIYIVPGNRSGIFREKYGPDQRNHFLVMIHSVAIINGLIAIPQKGEFFCIPGADGQEVKAADELRIWNDEMIGGLNFFVKDVVKAVTDVYSVRLYCEIIQDHQMDYVFRR